MRITIDEGEWLKGADEFNMLEAIPQDLWDAKEMARKASSKLKMMWAYFKGMRKLKM